MTQTRFTLKKQTLMDRFLCERIACGGALHTRAGLYDEMVHVSKNSRRCADFFAFSYTVRALTDEDIASMYAAGQLINTIPDVFPAE